jgi:hypothetical protein
MLPESNDSRLAILAEAERALRAVRQTAQPGGLDDPYFLLTGKVGGVLTTLPRERHCVLGKPQHMSSRSQGVVKHGYFPCRSAKCPHCVFAYCLSFIDRALDHFDYPQTLHRSVIRVESRNTRAVRNLHANHEYLWVRGSYPLDRVYLTADPHPGSQEVPAVEALVEAILEAPAHGRRYGGLPGKPRSGGDWRIFDIPTGWTAEEMNALATAAIDRHVAGRASENGRFFIIEGLTEDEVDRIWVALEPVRAAAADERERRRQLRADARELEAWLRERLPA